MSFRALTFAFLTLFLVATVATGIATFAATRSTIVRLVDERIEAISGAVAGDGEDGKRPSPAVARARVARLSQRRDTGDIGFVLTDARGAVLIANVRLARRLPLGFSTLRRDDQIDGLTAGRAFVRRIGAGLTLTTIAETEPVDHYPTARLWIFLGGFGAVVLIVLGGVTAFGRAIAGRMTTMRRTVDAIVGGDLARRLPVGANGDEFDRQAQSFNHMLDRMIDLMEGLRTISNDVAHDLRTPLARLRGQLDVIARRTDASALKGEIEHAIDQADTLLDMFAAMLRISEIDAGKRVAGFVPIELNALVTEIAGVFEPVAAETGHRLVLGRIDRVAMMGDVQLLTQAIVNLVENALAHTPAGSTIRLEAIDGQNGAILVVRDDGPGIPIEQRGRALRRFGRLDASRITSGHGLGLPLVAAIARLHGGALALDDAAPGLAASLSLKQEPASKQGRTSRGPPGSTD